MLLFLSYYKDKSLDPEKALDMYNDLEATLINNEFPIKYQVQKVQD
jgi:hypothetical protein